MSLAALLESLPIPVIQAPMVGASLDALPLAVSRAGGLGSFAAATLSPAEIGPAVAALRAQTDAPFAVNLLMAPATRPEPAEVDAALARLAPWYAELGAPTPDAPNRFSQDFEAQLEAVTRAAPPVASFTFSVLTRAQVDALHQAGTYVVGTANTVAEARAWAEAGADGICAQGAEAGGHHTNFLAGIEASLIGTMALVATVREAVDLPVIAAGGIMDGRGVAAALALGASAAQMGTAFLLADQAVTPGPWQRAIAAATDDPTRMTRAFSGRYARGIENRFMREMRAVEREVPAYPVQNRLTQPLRAAAEQAGDAEMMSLWAGQAVRLTRAGDAGEMLRRWWNEAQAASRELARRTGA
ncbi:nitronate monooxygenase [Phenylobacterium hankyongense]|uniref:Nitronate monooxygenase n=1 Tax=Phenylobacterium hankyongense TaxID=1813876 RepID=A0A328AWB0_9CAUL|nr:nitronate monooxygenase [Phenylobacterium hankyongense]RAK58535.1 nitronate monooxygenase [Phenylobacterium hankyongense]